LGGELWPETHFPSCKTRNEGGFLGINNTKCTRAGRKVCLRPFESKSQSIILTKAAFKIFSREKALGTGRRQRSRDKVAAGLPSSRRRGESLFLICPDLGGDPGARKACPLILTALPPALWASGFLFAD
jgi:hypothetical protein